MHRPMEERGKEMEWGGRDTKERKKERKKEKKKEKEKEKETLAPLCVGQSSSFGQATSALQSSTRDLFSSER